MSASARLATFEWDDSQYFVYYLVFPSELGTGGSPDFSNSIELEKIEEISLDPDIPDIDRPKLLENPAFYNAFFNEIEPSI